jgi:hypothetical protein
VSWGEFMPTFSRDIRAISGFILVVCLMVVVGDAQARRRGDEIWKFEVGGVKLNMSAKEAIAALQAKFGPNLKVIVARSTYDVPDNVIAYFSAKSRLIPDKTYISGIEYSVQNKYKYEILFAERIPGEDDSRPETAVRINLFQNDIHTREDMYQLDKAILEKYGTPTFDSDNPGYFHRKVSWCVNDAIYGGDCQKPHQPFLEWSRHFGGPYFLDLNNTDYMQKVDEAYDRILKASKPPL